jgi:hypothetical protein
MNEFAQALLAELEKKKKKRVKVPVTWETLGELIRDALNPKPVEEDPVPFSAPPVFFNPDAYPKLKVKYGADLNLKGVPTEKIVAVLSAPRDLSAQAWIVVRNEKEEEPFHGSGWLTRSIDELEKLKADGIAEFVPPKKKGAA